MQPTGHLRDGAVRVDGNEIELSRVEAAHLLFRGDLSGVTLDSDGGRGTDTNSNGDPASFERFFVESAAAADRFAVRYLVYADLRDRGFYLSPARDPWPGGDAPVADAVDFVAYERGSTPNTGNVKYPVQVVGERESVSAAGLDGRTLAVVDEESDITYFAAARADLAGTTEYEPAERVTGVLLSDRVVVWDAPEPLYERGFYGQPLTGRAAAVEGAIQLSLVEAASLAADGALSLSASVDTAGESLSEGAAETDGPAAAIVARGRAVEGERFDRRLAVYRRLREADAVPKTGFKFGADFRTYLDVETVDDLPHSEHLVRVVDPDHRFSPRELSLDVRLAGGVRKEMVFALAGVGEDDGDNVAHDADVEWLSIGRLTP
jgi:tRNA-intron endonuclease